MARCTGLALSLNSEIVCVQIVMARANVPTSLRSYGLCHYTAHAGGVYIADRSSVPRRELGVTAWRAFRPEDVCGAFTVVVWQSVFRTISEQAEPECFPHPADFIVWVRGVRPGCGSCHRMWGSLPPFHFFYIQLILQKITSILQKRIFMLNDMIFITPA